VSRLADRNVRPPPLEALPLDLCRCLLDALPGNRPALTRPEHPGQHLQPVERLAAAGPLDDVKHQAFRPLERGEAPPAPKALSAAANGIALIDPPRIKDPTVPASAVRASHRCSYLLLYIVARGIVTHKMW